MKTRVALFAFLFIGLLVGGTAAAIPPPQRTLFFVGIGSGPVIDCDFKSAGVQVASSLTASSLCPTSTFSRSSTAYDFNSSGLLTSYALDVPRVPVYNPGNGATLGLRIEEQRTNALSQSNDFTQSPNWTWANAALVSAAATSPDGTNNAWKLKEDSTASSGHGFFRPSPTVTTGQTVVWSIFAKAGERTQIALEGFDGTGSKGTSYFDLSAGTVISTGAGATATITSVGNGWYRCVITFTVTNNRFDPKVWLAVGGAIVYSGNGTSGAYVYGAQFEQNVPSVSTYIPTTSAAATRSPELAGFAVSATKLGANPSGMTLVVRGRTGTGFSSGVDSPMFYLSDGSSSNAVYLVWNTVGALRLIVKSGASFQVLVNLATGVAANTDFTVWLAMAPNNFSWQLIGQAKQTQSSGSMPLNLSSFKIGTQYDNGAFWNGTIGRIIVYKTRLSDTQAASIATSLSTASLDPANDNELVKLAQGY